MNRADPKQPESSRDLVLKVLSLVVLILDLVVLLGMAVTMPATAASFRRTFADMNRALPSLTAFFLGMPVAVYPLVLGFVGVALVVKEFLARPAVRLCINIAMLPLALVTAGAYVLSLFLPMMAMLRAIRS